MAGLLLLTAQDFKVERTEQGTILTNNIRGMSLILFYSNNCKYCHALIPLFKSLPGSIPNCQLGIINVLANYKVVEMSKTTSHPLTVVPYIVFYYMGTPLYTYNGSANAGEIKSFVYQISKELKNEKFFKEIATKTQRERKLLSFGTANDSTTTNPNLLDTPQQCDSGVCYIERK